MRKLFSLALILSLGCQHSDDRQRALPAVAIAVSASTCDVVPWSGDLPLISEAVNETPDVGTNEPVEVILWRKNLDAAVEESGKTGKPVWLHVIRDHCRPCLQIKKTTYSNPQVIKAINSQFVPVEVNQSKRRLNVTPQVKSFPTDIVLTVRGMKYREVYRNQQGAPETVQDYLTRLKAGARAAQQRSK